MFQDGVLRSNITMTTTRSMRKGICLDSGMYNKTKGTITGSLLFSFFSFFSLFIFLPFPSFLSFLYFLLCFPSFLSSDSWENKHRNLFFWRSFIIWFSFPQNLHFYFFFYAFDLLYTRYSHFTFSFASLVLSCLMSWAGSYNNSYVGLSIIMNENYWHRWKMATEPRFSR